MTPQLPPSAAIATRPAYLFLLVILAIHLTLGAFAQVANPAFGIVFGELFIFAGLTLLYVRGMNFRPVDFLALRLPPARAWLPTLVVGIAGFFASGAVNALNRILVGPELAGRFDVTRLFEFRSPFEGALLVLGVAVCAPIGEELLFRGFLLRVLRARYGVLAAILVTSALFAAFHFNPASILALFALGVVFALLRLWSGSIWPAVLGHGIQNGIASALILSGLASDAPDELPAGEALVLLAVSAPAVIAALAWLKNLGAAPDAEEVEAVEPEADHRFLPSRVSRPATLGLVAAALLSLGLLFAVDGEAALARLQRARGPRAPATQPATTPTEPGEYHL